MPAPTGAFAVLVDEETGETFQWPLVCLAVVEDDGDRHIEPVTMSREGHFDDPRHFRNFVMIRFMPDRLTDADVQEEARDVLDRIANEDKGYAERQRKYAAERAAKLAEVTSPARPTGNTNWNVTL